MEAMKLREPVQPPYRMPFNDWGLYIKGELQNTPKEGGAACEEADITELTQLITNND